MMKYLMLFLSVLAFVSCEKESYQSSNLSTELRDIKEECIKKCRIVHNEQEPSLNENKCKISYEFKKQNDDYYVFSINGAEIVDLISFSFLNGEENPIFRQSIRGNKAYVQLWKEWDEYVLESGFVIEFEINTCLHFEHELTPGIKNNAGWYETTYFSTDGSKLGPKYSKDKYKADMILKGKHVSIHSTDDVEDPEDVEALVIYPGSFWWNFYLAVYEEFQYCKDVGCEFPCPSCE